MNFKLNKRKLFYSLILSIVIAIVVSLLVFFSIKTIYGDVDNTSYAIGIGLIYLLIIFGGCFFLIYIIKSLLEKSIDKRDANNH
jgi:TRAP-type C4-dicarboxylate transport system permease small subunit